MVADSHVDSCDVHAGLDELGLLVDVPGGWPEGAHDLGLSVHDIDVLEDLLVLNDVVRLLFKLVQHMCNVLLKFLKINVKIND